MALALLAQAQGAPRGEKIPTIRVLVAEGNNFALESKGPIELVKPNWPRPLLAVASLPKTQLLLKDGKLHFGGLTLEEKWLTFRVKNPEQPLEVGSRAYPGEVHIVVEGKAFRVVNEVDMELYVRGVVPAEIGSGAPLEAMKVQAVAARSFAVARMGGFRDERSRPVYDVVDDTRDQVYVGVPPANTNLLRACEATFGMYVQYKGKTVCTYFSSSCGGHTLDVAEWSGASSLPPLSGVPCGFCGENAPNGKWEVRLTLEQLGKKLQARLGQKPLRRVSVLARTKSDRAATVLVEHLAGQVKVDGGEFTRAIGGRNTNFTVKQDGDRVLIRGTGFGHGVGLCQIGALGMAAKGKTFQEILNHYFPQHELAVLYGPLRLAALKRRK